MLAATHLGVPSVIHEQNAILGRANRLLAPRVTRIATAFRSVANLREADRDREIGRAHVLTPVTNAPLVCRPLLETYKRRRHARTTQPQRRCCVSDCQAAPEPHSTARLS